MPLWSLFAFEFLVLAVATYFGANVPTIALLAAFLLLLSALVIITPLRRLIEAMGTNVPESAQRLSTEGMLPSELRQLVQEFKALVTTTTASHKRDVEVSRVKSDFISTAAHQLRTPLTGIRWALEALEKSELTDDQRGMVKDAADKSRELVGIVGTLLDISAIESGKYKYAFAPCELPGLLAEVSRDFQKLAKDRNVRLYFADTEPVPPIRADRERVRWVLDNLVENAIRYTPSGGSVLLSASPGLDRVFVKVRDTGIGIQAKDSENIFERFFRGENAVNKESDGNGLGLYIARTIATDHGGDLNFEANEDGPGTTFTLSLPVNGPAGV